MIRPVPDMAEPHRGVPRRRCRHQVLLVMGGSTARRGYGRMLSTAGYGVCAASGPWVASTLIGPLIGAVGSVRFDVAVVQIGEPSSNGTALISALALRRVPVLAVAAAAADEELECAARRAGASAFLALPFGPHVLLPALRVLLSGACRPVPAVLHDCGGASDPQSGTVVWRVGG